MSNIKDLKDEDILAQAGFVMIDIRESELADKANFIKELIIRFQSQASELSQLREEVKRLKEGETCEFDGLTLKDVAKSLYKTAHKKNKKL